VVLSTWPTQLPRRGPGLLAAGEQAAPDQLVLAGGRAGRGARPATGDGPGCAVELTEVHAGGEAWWTLGFEATGPASLLHSELEAAAAVVFAQALPDGVELAIDDSTSYAQWLRQRPDAGSATEA
jgi:hypothetical protein